MNALAVKGLCKRYPAFSLENVSFSVPEGAVMGFIGRNGAGKSTTLKALLGLVHPDAGEVTVLGKSFREEEQSIKERIGVVLGGIDFYPKKKVRLPPVLRQLAGGEVPSLPESVRH
jgi:ABC-2 type transport system ATP-binding protein